MDFSRRLKLYLLGVLIGGVMAWAFFGQRLMNAGWTPKERIKKRLHTTLVKATPAAEGILTDRQLDLRQVREAVPASEVILKETRRSGDSLFYALDVQLAGHDARLVVAVLKDYDRDSTATLMQIHLR